MTAPCKHPGCEQPEYRIGYCTTHRSRFMRGADMDAPLRGTIPPEDLFWAKVRKSSGCWEWTATRSPEGYGNFWNGKSMSRAHRVSYEWAYGPIPEGMQIDHICLNAPCVRPDHLRLATNSANGQNRSGAYSNGASGVRGVSWHKRSRKWQAYSTVNYKRHYLGMYDDKSDAELAVVSFRRQNMPYSEMDKRKEPA